jgi:ubiquinone/menaquinone biosynthesis C-methylase UbiE
MPEDILKELDIEQFRKIFLKFTRKAFHLLPKTLKPYILDIGCGSGTVTVELASLCDGEILGIDIDQSALDKLNTKIKLGKLSDRVSTRHCSLYKNGLPDETFDILWEEGVLHLLHLRKSLQECSRLVKPAGFLVMNETIKWFEASFKLFSDYGFSLINHFLLPEKFWWTDYYVPLGKKIEELRIKFRGSKDLGKLRQYENEIKMVKRNPKTFDCGIYIMKKTVKR